MIMPGYQVYYFVVFLPLPISTIKGYWLFQSNKTL